MHPGPSLTVRLSYVGICGPPLALVGLRRPPPLRRLRASLHWPPVGYSYRPYPWLLRPSLFRLLPVALQVGHPRMLHLRGFRLLLLGLLVILGLRTAIVVAAPPPLLLIPLPLNLQSWFTTFARRRGRCPIPLLHLVVVSNHGSTPPQLRPRYRVYPRVDAVESEVADRAAALHRRSKPLSAVLPHKIRRYAVAAPQTVNPSFSRLASASAVGSKRWGSVTFVEMERLERLFRCQLEATSSSLWMMSGILTMLKRDGFNPSTPGLFNTAIASVSASLAFQARTAASGSAFLRSKRRESLLAHSKVPILEPQKRALIVTPPAPTPVCSMSLSSTWWRLRLRRIP